jgi:4-alpha-glucanotransferase
VVAGVPPDSFRKTGQLWELPVYRWDVLRAQNYRWWIERLRTAFGRFAVNRLDHFIGYVRTYEIPAQARTAIDGQYRPGAGSTFFNSVREALGSVSFIADDLGDTNSEVVSLLSQLQIPGDRVLQYEFDAELESNPHQAPHPLQTVVYTGTHDNDTTAGWYGKLSENQRATPDKKLGTKCG